MTTNPQRLDNTMTRDEPWSEPASVDRRRDRVRWGPVWAGVIVALPAFIVLQLFFFALGWLDLGFEASGTAASIVSGILALVAFFLGGFMAGACALWRDATDGLLHGVLVWALSVVAILAFTLFGGGALLGALASAATEVTNLQQQLTQNPDLDAAQALQAARELAGWGALGLGLSVTAAALGGRLGSKVWPGRHHNQTTTVS